MARGGSGKHWTMAPATVPYDLAGPEHDLDSGWGRPARSYVVCSMPRSGSSLLAEALHATGAAATPIEYLDRTNTFAVLMARWGCPSVGDYLRHLHRFRCSADGRFGVKVHWFHLAELTGALTAEGVVAGEGWCGRRHEALRALAPQARFVQVTRDDRERQAVSWFVAGRTGRWSSIDGRGRPGGPPDDYDFAAIERLRRRIVVGDRAWAALLRESGADVLGVRYEQLTADYEATVHAVARHLGVDLPGPVAAPRLRRQADDHTDRLVERFCAERAARRR
jgi:trehalose 2-sulfotransferase